MLHTDFVKTYVKQLETASYRNGMGASQLFYDFVFYYTNKMRALTESSEKTMKEYERLYDKYSDEVRGLFDNMLRDLIEVLNEHPDDYLGLLYTRLGAHKKGLGQYYTPFHVSKLMAQINLSSSTIDKKEDEPFTVSDPCCGSGSLLIGYVAAMKEKDINYAYDVVLYAQDVDPLAASMCYLQLSALGAAAVVNIGDSLTMDIHDSLPTLAFVGQKYLKTLDKYSA